MTDFTPWIITIVVSALSCLMLWQSIRRAAREGGTIHIRVDTEVFEVSADAPEDEFEAVVDRIVAAVTRRRSR